MRYPNPALLGEDLIPLAVVNLAYSIAEAVGAWTPGDPPNAQYNPGNIMADGVPIRYGEPEDGWRNLLEVIALALPCEDGVYRPEMSWLEWVRTYWAQNCPSMHPGTADEIAAVVTARLGVSLTDRVADYFTHEFASPWAEVTIQTADPGQPTAQEQPPAPSEGSSPSSAPAPPGA